MAHEKVGNKSKRTGQARRSRHSRQDKQIQSIDQ